VSGLSIFAFLFAALLLFPAVRTVAAEEGEKAAAGTVESETAGGVTDATPRDNMVTDPSSVEPSLAEEWVPGEDPELGGGTAPVRDQHDGGDRGALRPREERLPLRTAGGRFGPDSGEIRAWARVLYRHPPHRILEPAGCGRASGGLLARPRQPRSTRH